MADSKQRSGRYWRNLALFTLGTLLATAIVLVLAISLWCARAYTHPARHPLGDSPADHGLAFASITFASADGLSLAGWFIPAAADRANGAAIVLCHGYGSNRAEMLPEAAILTRRGYSALLFDFRGHGESEGDLVTLGYDEVKDVQAAVAYLRTRPEIAPERIGVLGHSMGAATAIRAAAQTPEIRAVAAEGAYASLADTIADNFGNFTALPRFPFAPLTLALGAWQTGLDAEKVRPVDDVARISPRPVLLIHGLADAVVAPENARQLYQAAGEPKTLWQPAGVGHAAAASQSPAEFEAQVIAFFDNALLAK